MSKAIQNSDLVDFIIKAIKKLLLFSTSQVFVLGIAFVWWYGWLKNPIIAAALAVFYDLIVLIWIKMGKPVWDEVWE